MGEGQRVGEGREEGGRRRRKGEGGGWKKEEEGEGFEAGFYVERRMVRELRCIERKGRDLD